MNLAINVVIEWLGDSSQACVERLLLIDPSGTFMVTIDIDPEHKKVLIVIYRLFNSPPKGEQRRRITAHFSAFPVEVFSGLQWVAVAEYTCARFQSAGLR